MARMLGPRSSSGHLIASTFGMEDYTRGRETGRAKRKFTSYLWEKGAILHANV